MNIEKIERKLYDMEEMTQEELDAIERHYKTNSVINEDIVKYVNGFDDKERKGYVIAMKFLESSFHINKTNGYIEYCKSKNV
jgi:hypothetical protein